MTRESILTSIKEFNPNERLITDLVVHCAATKEGKDYTVETIEKWHLEKGYSRIGYHFVIHPNGIIDAGRELEAIGAHVQGHNSHSVGICYIGGLDVRGNAKDTRTPEQKDSLEWLLTQLVKHIPTIRVIQGHRDYPNVHKDCPSFDAIPEYTHILQDR